MGAICSIFQVARIDERFQESFLLRVQNILQAQILAIFALLTN